MAESPWRWETATRRFRDSRSGRFLSAATAVDLRDGFQQRRRGDVDALVQHLAAHETTVQQWEADMVQAVRHVYTAQYAYGRGGLGAMSDADYAAADALVEAQRAYLRAFALSVAAGDLSAAQVRARARLYYAGSTQAYEHGRAAAWGVQPPHVPGDGSTPCKANCKCSLSYRETADTIEVRWQLHSGESCTGCRDRTRTWAPLVISKPQDGRIARLYRRVA